MCLIVVPHRKGTKRGKKKMRREESGEAVAAQKCRGDERERRPQKREKERERRTDKKK